MKYIILLTLSLYTFAQDPYQKDLLKLKDDMNSMGISLGLFSETPFQTGSSLQNYYISEKTLVLSRDTFFQMRGNKIGSTEELADYIHRTKVLKIHATNMLFQLYKSILNKEKDPLLVIEKEKTKKTLDELLKDCGEDIECVSKDLKENKENVSNIITQNVLLSTGVLDKLPYMHAFEVQSVYQLIQLMMMEVIYSQNIIEKKGAELFLAKQKSLLAEVERNPYLSKTESEFQVATIKNHINQWKVKVLKNRKDLKSEYLKHTKIERNSNLTLAVELKNIRNENKDIFSYLTNEKSCRKKWGNSKKKWCKSFYQLEGYLSDLSKGKTFFLNEKEQKLPKSFWEKL